MTLFKILFCECLFSYLSSALTLLSDIRTSWPVIYPAVYETSGVYHKIQDVLIRQRIKFRFAKITSKTRNVGLYQFAWQHLSVTIASLEHCNHLTNYYSVNLQLHRYLLRILTFVTTASTVWNISATTLSCFSCKLKTLLFTEAYEAV